MNGNAELLNFIYQNSQMGVESLEKLISVSKDSQFTRCLQEQLNEYKYINSEAKNRLNENGYDEKGIGTLTKIQSYIMLNFQTIMDKTTSHLAEMIIIGSNMGVIDAIKNIKKYNNVEPSILKLMEHLKVFEENNIEKLKQFL
ncbi:MAG: hypothetical protein ACRDA3_14585 [Peptostreptococcaceae bacterium]